MQDTSRYQPYDPLPGLLGGIFLDHLSGWFQSYLKGRFQSLSAGRLLFCLLASGPFGLTRFHLVPHAFLTSEVISHQSLDGRQSAEILDLLPQGDISVPLYHCLLSVGEDFFVWHSPSEALALCSSVFVFICLNILYTPILMPF